MLFIGTKHHMQIFGTFPFIKLKEMTLEQQLNGKK